MNIETCMGHSCTYIYIYIYIYIHLHIYIYIYTHMLKTNNVYKTLHTEDDNVYNRLPRVLTIAM